MVDRSLVVVFGFVETDGFVEAAADTVSFDRSFFDFFRDDNGETLVMTGVFRVNERDF